MKKVIPALGAGLLMALSFPTWAGDDPSQAPQVRSATMPILGAGEYGTDEDNENNSNTHTPDYDMDTYLFNTDVNTPIEFNIDLPFDPAGQGGTLVMNVYDIDAPDEVDDVYLNGTKIGSLTGGDGVWGYNRFTIPVGLLRQGRNKVKVEIDTLNTGYWAVQIDYAYITGLTTTPNKTAKIVRCWAAPTEVVAGEYVNFFAEVSGTPTKVDLYNGDLPVKVNGSSVVLTDPDGDGIYSADYQVPTSMSSQKGWKFNYRVHSNSANGQSWCPGFKVK